MITAGENWGNSQGEAADVGGKWCSDAEEWITEANTTPETYNTMCGGTIAANGRIMHGRCSGGACTLQSRLM